MKKNVVQDVVPSKKSIRDIDIPRNREPKDEIRKAPRYSPKQDPFSRPVSINQSANIEKEESPIKIEPTLINRTPPPPVNPPGSSYKYEYPKQKRSKKYLYIAGVLLIIVLAFGVSAMFKSAEIKVTPKQDTKTINESFTAKKDSAGNGLGYQVVTASKEIEKSIDPKDVSSEQKVEKKARGTIIIYNNFGPQPQKLVATTRFQTPEGLIYRLIEAVTVPGTVTKDGKTTAGSVEALVEADKSGVEYNIGLKDFTVPGLKGDSAKYKQIYARSKTDMTGGFSGMQKVVTKDVLAKAEIEMEASLRTSLSKDLVSQIPSDFVLYENSMSFKFEPAMSTNSADGSVILKKKGVTTAVIFDRSGITKAILSKVFPDAGDNVIKIDNLDSLQFVISTSSIQNMATTLTFTLKGETNLQWIFDENKLKTELLGRSKKNANEVLASYPSIKEAWITTSPFWNSTVPNDPKKVTIVNTLTK